VGGPVTLEGETHIRRPEGITHGFSGDISGPGSILKYATSTVELSGTNNTYAGGTTVSNGVWSPIIPDRFPGMRRPERCG
jgi:autotransporter-associated beta strand protein